MQNCPIASEPHPQPFDWSFQKNPVRLPHKYYIILKKRTYRLLQHHRDRFLCLSDFGVAFDLTIFGAKYNVLLRLVLWGSCIARLVAEGGQDLVFGSRQCWQNHVTSYAQRWGFSFVSIPFINSCTNVFGFLVLLNAVKVMIFQCISISIEIFILYLLLINAGSFWLLGKWRKRKDWPT